MPPKKKIAQPIDRPLSRAYLRGFTGWSTAYPPGASDPASLRIMDNVWIDRNGAAAVRPGMRCLTYSFTPDQQAFPGYPGVAPDFTIVGSMELFYTADGSRAMLFAVREDDERVGFRALLMSGVTQSVYNLTDPEIGFRIPEGSSEMKFEEGTTYVKYLQINNKILALSDNNEPAKYFDVGERKVAKTLTTVSMPEWLSSHKPILFHPNADWINDKAGYYEIFNGILNPVFEGGTAGWSISDSGTWFVDPADSRIELSSRPTRTNLATNPLNDVATDGISGWNSVYKKPALLTVDAGYLRIAANGGDEYFGESVKLVPDGGPIEPRGLYVIAADIDATQCENPRLAIDFYTVDGALVENTIQVSLPNTVGRQVIGPVRAPSGAVSMRIAFGGTTSTAVSNRIRVKSVVVCKSGEATTAFDGNDGANYFWVGTPFASASVYHPPQDVTIWSNRAPIEGGTTLHVAAELTSNAAGVRNASLSFRAFSRDGSFSTLTASDVPFNPAEQLRLTRTSAPSSARVEAELRLTVRGLERGDSFYATETLLCSTALALPDYFDGNTTDTNTVLYSWEDEYSPHYSRSRRAYLWGGAPALVAETPTAATLVKTGGSSANPYKMAMFYTFENETGESTPSPIAEIRMQRPWSNWYWETPNASGEPSGTATEDPLLACDQIVAQIREAVYDRAVDEGALKWNLYAISWSDQDPVPVEADLVATRIIRPTPDADAAPYDSAGWLVVTPQKLVTSYALNLPTRSNRTNYSEAPRHRNGLVAGERLILVADPANPAGIQWTSNLPANSMNFTPLKGGGSKTLTTGNLNIPVDVALWQNPQSVDTLTILCNGDDGESIAYYMAPASVNQNSSGAIMVMGFEQVTNTPGTEAVYGSEVMNNALYRPVDYGLVKSTANNYSLKHKVVSDDIANMWHDIRNKELIVTAQLENRLYLLVNNALGTLLEPGCRGNELWVYDIASENGSWSRFTIQAQSLKVLTVGNRAHLGIIRPDGIFYLDPYYRMDDWVTEPGGYILQRPIEWYLETNTQGANRAHDAWCHLQQVVPTFGNMSGTLRYGIKAQTVDGKRADFEKVFTDDRPYDHAKTVWDVQDALLVRRDMMEWFFYAGSVTGEYSHGQLHAVQYRYAPVSVNVGYEYGSVETYEYGRNVAIGPDVYSDNGIPTPYMDYTRP